MNLVIIYGTIITNIDFRFIYDRFCEDKDNIGKYNHISIASCKLKLLNESIITIYGYDDVADIMIKKLKLEDYVIVEGRLDNTGRIEIMKMY